MTLQERTLISESRGYVGSLSFKAYGGASSYWKPPVFFLSLTSPIWEVLKRSEEEGSSNYLRLPR